MENLNEILKKAEENIKLSRKLYWGTSTSIDPSYSIFNNTKALYYGIHALYKQNEVLIELLKKHMGYMDSE